MCRFHGLTLQPTLFGGASVIPNWGQIGTNEQAMIETVDETGALGSTWRRR
ncbi:WGR domain-containing protein [Aminobacter sp. BA135]|uniref:WGR domain-containing protein n=1 Tax=Aminobacter sp. BA135 TaxID=537596 RepID=UPI003D78E173